MQTAYQILAVPTDASDHDIKQAYLRKVRDNPPDRDQNKFQQIHEAFSSIKDHKSRLTYELFNLPDASFDQLLEQAFDNSLILPIAAKNFIEILRTNINEDSLLNSLKRSQ